MITRRTFSNFALAGALAGFSPLRAWAADGLAEALERIEKDTGARLGVAVLDTESGARHGHRADERFAMCSTFKWLAAAAILRRVDDGRETLDRRMTFTPAALIPNSPAAQKKTDGAMTLEEACDAAITLSDNTAGNLLLSALGGPPNLTQFARFVGDAVTRLDRNEPTVNTAIPGDERDTTTPSAMLADMQKILLGDVLSPASRDRLVGWLVANKTGGLRLRAGLPKEWRVGDKTGLGDYGTNNDIAIAWSPQKKPVLIAAYLTETKASVADSNAALAKVAREIAKAVG